MNYFSTNSLVFLLLFFNSKKFLLRCSDHVEFVEPQSLTESLLLSENLKLFRKLTTVLTKVSFIRKSKLGVFSYVLLPTIKSVETSLCAKSSGLLLGLKPTPYSCPLNINKRLRRKL